MVALVAGAMGGFLGILLTEDPGDGVVVGRVVEFAIGVGSWAPLPSNASVGTSDETGFYVAESAGLPVRFQLTVLSETGAPDYDVLVHKDCYDVTKIGDSWPNRASRCSPPQAVSP